MENTKGKDVITAYEQAFITQAEAAGITLDKDTRQAIHQLAYRRAYNMRPDVKATRKVYNQRRQARIKAALAEYDAKHTVQG